MENSERDLTYIVSWFMVKVPLQFDGEHMVWLGNLIQFYGIKHHLLIFLF